MPRTTKKKNLSKVWKNGRWNVEYGDTVLRSFSHEYLADLYLFDSAEQDAHNTCFPIIDRTLHHKGKSVRHLESGVVYISLRACASALGLSYSAVKTALSPRGNGMIGDQHFELAVEAAL